MEEALISSLPIVRTSLAEMVYARILEAIVAGQFAPGSEISEVAVSEKLQVSRTPVHEALRRLAADGLVEQLPTRRLQVAKFSLTDVAEIYEVRKVLEAAAVERAATRMDAEKLTALRREADALAASFEAADWNERALAFDVLLHDSIAAACGNEHLRRDVARYRRLVQAFCRMTGSASNLRDAFDEHLKIVGALEARDGDVARRAMNKHIDARVKMVLGKVKT